MESRLFARVEMKNLDGGAVWVDVTNDVHGPSGIQCSRGLPGAGPTDRVAETGWANFTMINDGRQNSGGLDGYYSIGHTNARQGFDKGTEVRISVLASGEWVEPGEWVEGGAWVADFGPVVIWTGRVSIVRPSSGQHRGERLARVECRDFMDLLVRHRIPLLEVARGVNESTAVELLHAALQKGPQNPLEITDGPDTLEFVFDLARDESTSPQQELWRICQSTLATYYIKANGAPKYEPRNEKRYVAGSPLTPDINLTGADIRNPAPLDVTDSEEGIVNKVTVTYTPRELVGTGTPVVLAALKQALSFAPGEVHRICLEYTDLDEESERIGGYDFEAMTTPTDYEFWTEPDGTGTDLSASVTVTPTHSGNSVELEIDTTAISQQVYAGGTAGPLQVRGVGVVSKEQVHLQSIDQPSIDALGENAIVVDLPYQSQPAVARGIGDHLLDTLLDDERKLGQVWLYLDPTNLTRVAEIAAREISDIFTVVDELTGLTASTKFHIQAIEWDFRPDGHVWTGWLPAPADAGFEVVFSENFLLVVGGNNKPANNFDTKSYQPTEGALVLVGFESKTGDGSVPNIPTLSGNGLTWSQKKTNLYDNLGLDRRRLTLFSAPASGATAGVLNFDLAGQTADRAAWIIFEIPDKGSGSGVIQAENGAGENVGTLAVSPALAAFAHAANRPILVGCVKVSDELDPEVGYTLIGRRTTLTSIMAAINEASQDLTPSMTIPGANGQCGIIGAEVDLS